MGRARAPNPPGAHPRRTNGDEAARCAYPPASMSIDAPRYLVPFDTFRLPQHLTEVLVIGSGVAGLSAALSAADAGARVHLLAKGDLLDSNTAWAQGGVAAVVGAPDADRAQVHADDTIEVGCGLCDEDLVRQVTGEAAQRIEDLMRLGARFDEDDAGGTARGLEAGHSHPRILHARGDATGAEIRDTLVRAVSQHTSVTTWADAFVIDLLTDDHGRCRGVLLFSRGHLRVIWAGATVLCAGGYAQVFRESSNVAGATGDGVAAAYRAGAVVQDMEFVQFHPTTLYLAGVPRMLITEAVRGEGAHIVDGTGARFLLTSDPRGELAPRDVISRAINRHLQGPSQSGVFLDLRHLDAARLTKRFPGVVASCAAHNLDIATDLIPIRPAAHYSIGGVRVDHQGRTSLAGLFAAGEVTASGLHGANRLASNSLLEGLVLGRRAGGVAAHEREGSRKAVAIAIEASNGPQAPMDADDLRASLKALLWREAGILRSGAHLAGASGALDAWAGFARRVGGTDIERLVLRNMLTVARLMVVAGLRREESRGTHARRDFSERDDERWRVRITHRRGTSMEDVPLPVEGAPTA